MTEYIEREALMKNFCGYDLTKCVKYGNESAEQQHDSYSTMMMYEIADEIEDAPTVDAVPVVRCRECKHWGDEDGKLQNSDGVLFARCKIHNYLLDGRHTGWCPTENDFCSYGERKEGSYNG